MLSMVVDFNQVGMPLYVTTQLGSVTSLLNQRNMLLLYVTVQLGSVTSAPNQRNMPLLYVTA
jgi:hypothetical protein